MPFSFWSNLQLWEKLSIVLMASILLTFIGAFCVLAHNRWRTRRYTEIEAQQKLEEADMFPMLNMDDIPFGARALERGHHVDGVWVGTLNAPIVGPYQPDTICATRSFSSGPRPYTIRPPSTLQLESTPGSSYVPSFDGPATTIENDVIEAANHGNKYYTPGVSAHDGTSSVPTSSSNFNRRSDSAPTNGKRTSLLKRASHLFEHKKSISDVGGRVEMDLGADGCRDSGFHTPPEEIQTRRKHRNLQRRRSSEEFRRRMSQIFNDRIRMNMPVDRLQFNSELQASRGRNFRRSILGAFRD
ncbi:hypothetical protein N7495_005653 [Penicillium taxi]|uniref:uncharacterized protein n=1 Tax=Penicillium taxi TaxID=168475 RepID=UPI00254596F9|nr:uncharacterized protein N7495_005653 [Penicillium taxi]KAJ5893962.1 hypothetical protein N7495_005653 [Penicillium taxi]